MLCVHATNPASLTAGGICWGCNPDISGSLQSRSLMAVLGVLALALLARTAPPVPVPVVEEPIVRKGGGFVRPAVLASVTGVAGVMARRPLMSKLRQLLGREEEEVEDAMDTGSQPDPEVSEARSEATRAAATDSLDESGEKFALTPERLTAIATLNPQVCAPRHACCPSVGPSTMPCLTPSLSTSLIAADSPWQLEKVGASLTAVPVFTAAVSNGTSPLTVPGEDGQKLAYFFTESADAEAFLAAVREHTGTTLEAQVIGVSLADIVRCI